VKRLTVLTALAFVYVRVQQIWGIRPTNRETMDRYVFAIGDETYCLWGYDLAEENEQFLKLFDASYFEYVARVHMDRLEGDDASRAAIALRAAYHHGLEALFSMLGALSQAPEAVTVWIPRCSNIRLRRFVGDVSNGEPILTQRGRQRVTWRALAEVVHSRCWVDEDPKWTTAHRYAKLWSHLGREFLDPLHIAEYNSIKHGFRVLSGGSVIRIGVEPSYGVAPPESAMQTIGASPHGVDFSTVEPLPANDPKSPHVRLARQRLNWRAESMIQALQLISWSLNNLVGFLRVINGAAPATVRFHRPEDPAAFEAPWRWNVGVTSGAMNFILDESEVIRATRDELRAELEQRTSAA
jgi:hypothetical protein